MGVREEDKNEEVGGDNFNFGQLIRGVHPPSSHDATSPFLPFPPFLSPSFPFPSPTSPSLRSRTLKSS